MGVIDHDDMLSNELIFARQRLLNLIVHIPWPDQSPLYFLYLRLLRIGGASPFAIQFVNAVLVTVTLIATYALALAVSGSRIVAGCALVLGTMSPTTLWLVRQGRMYPLQVLFAVTAALFVMRYLDGRRPRDLIAFALISVLNIYTHFLGFLITAALFVPIAFEGTAALLAAAGIAAASLPQIVRMVGLLRIGSQTRADVSLPALSSSFLDRVSWFWFINTDWGALGVAPHLATAVYVGSIVVLAAAGFAAMRHRVGVHAAMWILVPLALVGLVAARMDVRDRYFVWTLPLIWTAVAAGAFGALPAVWLQGARGDLARGVRAALAAVVIAGSIWLLWQKLPERRPESTKLMTALAQIYRPSMKIYMPPNSTMGIPVEIALERDLPVGLRDVKPLTPGTREQFLRETARGDEFVFLLISTPQNDEMRWRAQYLQQQGYRKAVIPVFAASAQIFTRQDIDTWSESKPIEGGASASAMVAWAREQLSRHPTADGRASRLSNGLVATVNGEGAAGIARVYSSQRGEWGAWRFGPDEGDSVEEARVSSARVSKIAMLTRASSGSVLVVALRPGVMKESLALTYGIADGSVMRSGSTVRIELYVNGERKSDVWCSGGPGWKTTVADTSAIAGKDADAVLLITSTGDANPRIAFRLDPSSSPALPSSDASTDEGPIVLNGNRRLSDRVENLRVYRVAGARRIDPVRDGRTYTAAEMHEAAGAAGEGMMHRVWSLGALPWDAVGSTRQRSGGVARKGVWAHPKNGTTLIVEGDTIAAAGTLKGYFGFTDFAIDRAAAVGATAPVRFVVSVDGATVLEREAGRTAGWVEFSVPAGAKDRAHVVQIRISADTDSWAHFVFDLWSE